MLKLLTGGFIYRDDIRRTVGSRMRGMTASRRVHRASRQRATDAEMGEGASQR